MNIFDRVTYFYIKNIKKWMECPVCHHKLFFNKEKVAWCCADCKYKLLENDFLDDFVFWFCDGCGSFLNVQEEFNRNGTSWVCTKCGFNNDITFNNIKGECKDCGILLDNPNATICSQCKTERLRKAQIVLQTTADFCRTTADALKSNTTTTDESIPSRWNNTDTINATETDDNLESERIATTMKKQYHVISAKNFGYESVLGDGTYDYFVFPAEEFSKFDALSTFAEITKETLKANNHWYSYTAYEYRGNPSNGGDYGKQYYEIIYSGLFDGDNVPFIP